MSRHRGRQQKSYGGTRVVAGAVGGRGGGGGGRAGVVAVVVGGGGGGGGGNRQGKISYDAGDEPAFIRQFKARTGYQEPITAEEKRRTLNDDDARPRDGDYRKDDEKPQIVQLNVNDLSKEEVDMELAKVKEAEEEKKCIDSSGRLLFRKPKEKSDDTNAAPTKSDIVEMASNKIIKRKTPITTADKDHNHGNSDETKKKAKTQLLSFMDESGFDGDD